jgi:hypothetical protein
MNITRDIPLAAFAIGAAFLLSTASPCRADLKKAMAQPNLEKRSTLALDNALAAFYKAKKAYDDGDASATKDAIAEIQESVELANDSLTQTGKNPRKKSTYFKRAEIATRDLLRRLDAFQQQMGYQDRQQLDSVKAHIQKIHDDILVGLMGGKK